MDFIPYFKLKTTQEEKDAVLSVLDSGWYTTGARCQEFETKFASMLGCKNALSFNSATAGLHLALASVGIKAGDKVLLSPYTFVASSEVILYFNAIPVFCDVRKDTYHLDPVLLEKALKEDTKNEIKAVIYIGIGGANIFEKEVYEICKRYNRFLISDLAHSVPQDGAYTKETANSDIAVYSFYANKTMTTGEGGMAVTNDANPRSDEFAKKMKILRLHGISRDVWDRFTSKKATNYQYDIVDNGFKYNLTDIAAAIGIVQLANAFSNFQLRKVVAKRYSQAFKDIPQISLPVWHDKTDVNDTCHSFHLYAIRLNFDKLTCSRDEAIEYITNTHNIGLSVHFIPIHTFSYYKNRFGYKQDSYPIAFDEYSRSISLPIFPSMDDSQIERVINAVKDMATKFSR